MSMDVRLSLDWMSSLGWSPTEAQITRYVILYEQILEVNRQLNLTRITNLEDYWEKHIWDSLVGIAPFLMGAGDTSGSPSPQSSIQSVIDIGTGGGFPGLPVAIACPDWQVTLLDSTQKKINALEGICQVLGLPNVNTICDRAEVLGSNPQYQSRFDLALIRAVGGATVCAEYCMPLIKVQGRAILYRGQWSTLEEHQLNHALDLLGGQLIDVHRIETPLTHNQRHCIQIQKMLPTPEQYPRRSGVAKCKPL